MDAIMEEEGCMMDLSWSASDHDSSEDDPVDPRWHVINTLFASGWTPLYFGVSVFGDSPFTPRTCWIIPYGMVHIVSLQYLSPAVPSRSVCLPVCLSLFPPLSLSLSK